MTNNELISTDIKEDASSDVIHLKNDANMEYQNLSWDQLQNSSASMKMNLGLNECGGDLSHTLPLAVELSRKAFRKSALHYEMLGNLRLAQSSHKLAGIMENTSSGQTKSVGTNGSKTKNKKHPASSSPQTPPKLTGLSLLYGPKAMMNPHYDSSTQPGQREEWLVMFTIGSDVLFRCNDSVIALSSGDALVMDSMSVLHGVEGIRKKMVQNPMDLCTSETKDNSQFPRENIDAALHYGLPVEGSRLGVLLWQGRTSYNAQIVTDERKTDDDGPISLEGFSTLFSS